MSTLDKGLFLVSVLSLVKIILLSVTKVSIIITNNLYHLKPIQIQMKRRW